MTLQSTERFAMDSNSVVAPFSNISRKGRTYPRADTGVPGLDMSPQRRAKRWVPEGQKDEHYWEKRSRNNLAAKRCREIRRQQGEELKHRVCFLQEENAMLRKELSEIKERFGLSPEPALQTEAERQPHSVDVRQLKTEPLFSSECSTRDRLLIHTPRQVGPLVESRDQDHDSVIAYAPYEDFRWNSSPPQSHTVHHFNIGPQGVSPPGHRSNQGPCGSGSRDLSSPVQYYTPMEEAPHQIHNLVYSDYPVAADLSINNRRKSDNYNNNDDNDDCNVGQKRCGVQTRPTSVVKPVVIVDDSDDEVTDVESKSDMKDKLRELSEQVERMQRLVGMQ